MRELRQLDERGRQLSPHGAQLSLQLLGLLHLTVDLQVLELLLELSDVHLGLLDVQPGVRALLHQRGIMRGAQTVGCGGVITWLPHAQIRRFPLVFAPGTHDAHGVLLLCENERGGWSFFLF
jgi:hypothetical protein